MRKDVIKQLIIVNYASTTKYNAQDPTTQTEKNKKIKRTLYKQLLGIFAGSLFYSVLFSLAMIFSPTEQIESVFSGIYSLLTTLLLFSSFSAIYSVFYESNDLQAFRPFPFLESEILFSKGISVVMSLLMYIAPAYALQVIAFIRFTVPWWLALLASVPLTILFISMLALIALLLVSVLAKTAWFGRYQKVLAALIMTLNVFALYIGGYWIRSFSSDGVAFNLPLYRVFYLAASQPVSSEFIMHLAAWVAIIIVLLLIVRKYVLPTFYESALATTVVSVPRQSSTRRGEISLTKSLWRYNFALIKSSSSVMYTTAFTALFPIVILGRTLVDTLREFTITPSILLGSSVLGMGYALMTTTASSLPAIIISLDGANFEYLQSIPFRMHVYFRVKFLVSYLIQSILPVVLIIGFQVWLGIPYYAIAISIAGYYLTAAPLSMFYFCRDYLNLDTHWQSVNDLVTRKKKGCGCVSGLLYFVSILALLFSFYGSQELPVEWALFIVVILWIMVLIIAYYYYHFRFRRLLHGRLEP